MIQLTYVSTALPHLDQTELDDIMQCAWLNNPVDQITGLLLFDGTRFLQLLEGKANAVTEAFSRIAADGRHHRVIKLGSRRIASRAFEGCPMASHFVTAGQPMLVDQIDEITANIVCADTRDIFRGFVRTMVMA